MRPEAAQIPVPLADAGPAGVRQHHAADVAEDLGLQEEVPFIVLSDRRFTFLRHSRIRLSRWWRGSARSRA